MGIECHISEEKRLEIVLWKKLNAPYVLYENATRNIIYNLVMVALQRNFEA
jgi:hypothetical protein